ncbi:MAG TPA: PAS domain S-box protein, partial [Phaeodactylibacter sp.]|nr:PAS domain S-box protein [Phaeodactylibacter sp.]
MSSFDQNDKSGTDAASQLEAIIETASDGIITINESGVIELVNPAAARLFGYTQKELLGHSINRLMPSPHAQQHDNYIQRYMQTGEARIIGIGREVQGKKKDGTLFPIRLSISEVPSNHGKRLFTGIVHDLTQQKQTEQALKVEKDRAQRYLDIANTIIVAIDKDGKVQLLNEEGCRMLEVEEAEVLGKDWIQFAVPPQYRQEVQVVFKALLQGRNIDYYENHLQAKSGKQYLIAWHNSVLRDETGQIIATLSSGINITAQRKAEEHISQLNTELEKRVEARTDELSEVVNKLLSINKQLKHEISEREAAEAALRQNEQQLKSSLEKEKELNALKSRFVSMASHEFRTPLSTILSSADLIEAYEQAEQQAKRVRHTKRIKSSVANLTSILNDFLSLSKLEEGKIAAQFTHFRLPEVWEEVHEGVQGLRKNGQDIRISGLEEVNKELYTDKRMLRNIFYNLLSNALKYSDENSPVDCRLSLKDNQLCIETQDYGIGIPEE